MRVSCQCLGAPARSSDHTRGGRLVVGRPRRGSGRPGQMVSMEPHEWDIPTEQEPATPSEEDGGLFQSVRAGPNAGPRGPCCKVNSSHPEGTEGPYAPPVVPASPSPPRTQRRLARVVLSSPVEGLGLLNSETSRRSCLRGISRSMTPEDLIRRPEGKTLEFKRELSSPRPALRTPVAFANSADGLLVVGVEDRTRDVLGVEPPRDVEERVANLVAGSISPACFPSSRSCRGGTRISW